ncbi:MAG: hypothetical protein ACM3MF_03850 [Anaerolineae bacterium]
MTSQTSRVNLVHPIERVLSVLAAGACLFITIAIWRSVSGNQPMWLLPGLYFVEMPAVALLTAAAFLLGVPASARIAWVAAGILLAFAVMGAFSVGLFYLPISVMFILLAVLRTVRQDSSLLRGVLVLLAAAVLQAAFMFLMIRLLYGTS